MADKIAEEHALQPTDDTRAQQEAVYQLLINVRATLERINQDSTGQTAYMHARNARIDLNTALRRLSHILGNDDAYPESAQ